MLQAAFRIVILRQNFTAGRINPGNPLSELTKIATLRRGRSMGTVEATEAAEERGKYLKLHIFIKWKYNAALIGRGL